MLHFVICDDNRKHNHFLEKWMERIFVKNGVGAEISAVIDNVDDLLLYAGQHFDRVNAYILDIDFEGNRCGLELARRIREVDRQSYIVFLTAHQEYLASSLQMKIFDYLVKPVSFRRMKRCILSLHEDYRELKSFAVKVPIKSGSSIHMVKVKDIIYLEKCGQQVEVHLVNGMIRSYESLKSMVKALEGYGFISCHRSYLVNAEHVRKICLKERSILMSNGEKCYISRRCRKEVLKHFPDII
ncbi:MAG: response regulator transcription factor [Firmicutes bacterium]|jgi:two-component system response regulator AgrA|nr:response regulator transcription factor [Bacillota bacterium]